MVMTAGSYNSRVVATKVVATDGTGDFTNIQDAIDDLPSGGGVVYIKEGTYNITTSISITSNNVSLIGAGKSSIITSTLNIALITITSANNCTIENLYIKGDGVASNQKGLAVSASTNVQITGCRFESLSNEGILCSGSSIETKIINNYFKECDDTVIATSGLRTLVSDNYLISCAGTGILINQDHCIVKNNILLGMSAFGIVVGGADFVTVLGNNIQNIDNTAILISSSNDCIVSNNIIEDAGDDSSENGITITTSDRINITGNSIRTVAGYGIDVTNSACNDTFIHGNIISDATTGTINDSGTTTVQADNIPL